MAALTFLPLAFLASRAALNGVLSTPIFRSRYSSPTEMHWPARLRRGGVRIWPPSMPFFAEPRTRLSRVVPQDDCLSTSTSVMPYLAKKPFSAATNSGAASVRAIKPSLALVVSTSVPAAQALDDRPSGMPPSRAIPLAATIDCFRKRRREAISTLLLSSLLGLSVIARFPLGEKKRCHADRLSRGRGHRCPD